jgi:excisionase family DNA binding protein
MQSRSSFPELMTAKQAAEYLQVSRETVYRYIRQGELVASRLGRTCRVQKRNLDLLLWKKRTKQMPLRQYAAEEVEAFLREDELDAKAAQIAARAGSIVAATAGIFKTGQLSKTAEELRVLAEEGIAEDVMERTGDR